MRTESFGEGDAETMQQEFLLGVRLRHATQADGVVATAGADRKYDVTRLDLVKLVKQTPWCVPPKPLRRIQPASVFHIAYAKKHTKMCAFTRSSL